MKMKPKMLLVVCFTSAALLALDQYSAQAQAEKPVVVVAPANTDTNAPGEPPPPILTDEAPLTAVIKFLARQANLNVMFDPKVNYGQPDATGKVTPEPVLQPLRFENVTAQQALSAILDNYNLVMIQDTKTRIARITVKDAATLEPLITRIYQLKYGSPTNMALVILPTLSTPRSKVLADGRTSQLVILATEKEMDGVEALVTQLDAPTKQVLIEARLIETKKNLSTIKGIDWRGTFRDQNVTFGNGNTFGSTTTTIGPGTGAGTGTGTGPGGRPLGGGGGNTTTENTSLTTTLGNGGLSLDTARGFHPETAFLNATGVRAVLDFFNEDGDSEIIATPRAVTIDNQTANLSVTEAFPIFEITPGSANSPAGAKVTYTNLGTILQVTPRIAANNNISLKVIPEVSRKGLGDEQIINGVLNRANSYLINRIETSVIIPSGNTLVMGGLIRDEALKSYTKVPLLGDMPVIGGLFRHKAKLREKRNLIIFITPTIVQDLDYQPAMTDFLQNRLVPRTTAKEWDPDRPVVEPTAWDSAKPYDWSRKTDKKHSTKTGQNTQVEVEATTAVESPTPVETTK